MTGPLIAIELGPPSPPQPPIPLSVPQKAALADWKKVKVWMMMIAASLMWAGAAEKPEQSKMTFKNHQNDSKQLI